MVGEQVSRGFGTTAKPHICGAYRDRTYRLLAKYPSKSPPTKERAGEHSVTASPLRDTLAGSPGFETGDSLIDSQMLYH